MKTEKSKWIIRAVICTVWGWFIGCFIAGLIASSADKLETPEEPAEEVQEVSLAGVEFLFSRWGSR